MRLKHDCLICNSPTLPYFSKDFQGQYRLERVDYWRCKNCGFVLSKTHYDMSNDEWEVLNVDYHSSYQNQEYNPDDPRWFERLQAQVVSLTELAALDILPKSKAWVDYGCGDGNLASLLEKNHLPTLKYDRYMKQNPSYLKDTELQTQQYSVVINTSVFEHIRERETLDSINSLVSDEGVLVIHTLVNEVIPGTPDWFYLLPPHCSFFTNKSMQILFEDWGYDASIYHVPSRMWFWFRRNGDLVQRLFDQNLLNSAEGFYFKKGFMNYWGVYS